MGTMKFDVWKARRDALREENKTARLAKEKAQRALKQAQREATHARLVLQDAAIEHADTLRALTAHGAIKVERDEPRY
jgi:hypothetical protein